MPPSESAFIKEYGINLHSTLIIDILHGFFLGILNNFCKLVVWAMIDLGVFARCGTIEETIHISVMTIRTELDTFYKQRHRLFPGENLTRVGSFVEGIIGKNTDRHLSTKGAET